MILFKQAVFQRTDKKLTSSSLSESIMRAFFALAMASFPVSPSCCCSFSEPLETALRFFFAELSPPKSLPESELLPDFFERGVPDFERVRERDLDLLREADRDFSEPLPDCERRGDPDFERSRDPE